MDADIRKGLVKDIANLELKLVKARMELDIHDLHQEIMDMVDTGKYNTPSNKARIKRLAGQAKYLHAAQKKIKV